MLYGVVKYAGQKTSIAVLESKKIKRCNIAEASQMQVLLQRIGRGDTVWAVSVADFCNVTMFYVFADGVVKAGASLRIIQEPYLEVGNGKMWKDSIREHIQLLSTLEQTNVRKLLLALNLNARGRDFVAGCVMDISISILALTYSQEGILHRG